MTTVHNHINDLPKCINHKQNTIQVENAREFNIDYRMLVNRRNLLAKARNNKFLTCKWLRSFMGNKAIGCHAHQHEVFEGDRKSVV